MKFGPLLTKLTGGMKMKLLGRKFVYGIVAITCVSWVAVSLQYSGDVYVKLVSIISGLFLATQAVTDFKERQ